MSKQTRNSVRFVALTLLERVDKGGAYSNLVVKEAIEKSKLNSKDARLLTEMVYGTISQQLRLDFYLAPFLKQAKKIDPWVRCLLRLSVYQLEFLDKVPSHAILNEAVEIAKERGNIGASKFVNGVLRTLQREGVPSLENISDEKERLSIEFSLPLWLVETFIAQMGIAETRTLGQSLLEPSHVSGRVDTRFCTRENALKELNELGIEAKASKLSAVGVVAEKGFLAGSQLFQAGEMTIQDESSMLVAPILQVAPNHHVLDACAAPGGKTTHIATYLDKTQGGQVTALDIHPHKVKLIQQNADRLHVADVVEARQLDAREVATTFEAATFDRILVDAPCSGMGLIRRKPDIKYQKQASDFEKLPTIQLEILESVAPTLKSGGLLVYSTCTILSAENEAVVAAFLANHPEFELAPLTVNRRVQTAVKENCLTIYPQTFHSDGFFISCLRKK